MEITQPTIFVISAPSGAGKTTMIHKAQELIPEIELAVSHTSRKPREGELEGKDYFFLTSDEFKQKIKHQEFIEWAEVHGNYYGTSIKEVQKRVNEGKIIVLDIDVQGAKQIMNASVLYPVYIFIEPPSLEELYVRLQNRASETEESYQKRVNNAEKELAAKDQYDYIIVNDTLERAVNELIDIIKKHINYKR